MTFTTGARALGGLAAVMLMLAAATGGAVAQEVAASPKRWSWIENTIWYVPPKSLPAIMTSAASPAVGQLVDQTVYSIDGYSNGYFWGVVRAQLMPSDTPLPAAPDDPPTCMRLAGSVTPQGTLNLSFAPMSDTGDRTTGVGFMQRHAGDWTMELQMTTGDTVQVTHWAYMKYCEKGQRCPLPAISATAQSFLKPCKDML